VGAGDFAGAVGHFGRWPIVWTFRNAKKARERALPKVDLMKD
jgi:hypothetical protein